MLHLQPTTPRCSQPVDGCCLFSGCQRVLGGDNDDLHCMCYTFSRQHPGALSLLTAVVCFQDANECWVEIMRSLQQKLTTTTSDITTTDASNVGRDCVASFLIGYVVHHSCTDRSELGWKLDETARFFCVTG